MALALSYLVVHKWARTVWGGSGVMTVRERSQVPDSGPEPAQVAFLLYEDSGH